MIADACQVMEKVNECQKEVTACSIDHKKAFSCVSHVKLQKALRKIGVQEHWVKKKKKFLLWNLGNQSIQCQSETRKGHFSWAREEEEEYGDSLAE